VRPLERLREDRRLRDLVELAVVAERPALERLQDDVDRLVPAGAAGVELEPEPLELVVLVAAAEPDVDPAPGEEVERRDLLRGDERMVQRHDDHRGADAQPRGLGRDVRRELDRARQVAVRREVMLGQPDVPEAERLGRLRDVDAAREDLLGRSRGR